MSATGISAGSRPIARLPQAVADAIAAGEVVERPASVVKELCENAIDAGAGRLDVAIDGAGTVRIRVVDDGCGIAAEELPLALARHATSKIRVAADLEEVRSLGFRGEALASIAAVADVTVRSRARGSVAGSVLRVRHGETVETESWGGPDGTSVEVLDLFAATPARLRFLRGERSETAAALTVVSDLALVHPEVSMSCVVDGRTRLRSPGTGIEAALRCVFGADADQLLPVAAEGDINVGGAISEPRRHRGARTGLVLVVNGRRVHNRALLAAVADAYRGLVPQGRYPFGVVSIEVDAHEVDVNVHPTKREVRFRDERRVFAAVQRACWEALREASVYRAASATPLPEQGSGSPGWGFPVAGEVASWRLADGTLPAADDDWGAAHAAPDELGGGENVRGGLSALRPLRALGQQAGRWLLATSPAGVVLVDPHAAHEKVLYSELVAAWSSGSPSSQLLLIPALVECDARRLAALATHAELVSACGFAVEAFGPTTVRCTAVPSSATAADPARLLGDLLDSLTGEGPVTELRHRAAALIACHAAVRFGDELTPEAQQRLLDRLVTTPGGISCPHGRPTVAVFDDATLRRLFRRPPG